MSENDKYKKEFDLMEEHAEDMLKRKIHSSLHQSAQILHHILNNISDDSILLSVGAYDDLPTEVLTGMGYHVAKIDPVINMDLHEYRMSPKHNKFDLIFSTSVIEHEQNDEQFIIDMCDLLKPGGLCLFTCDFKPDYVHGDPLPTTAVRFYTKGRLIYLLDSADTHGCKPTNKHEWNITPDELDFQWEGIDYCFAGVSLRKGPDVQST